MNSTFTFSFMICTILNILIFISCTTDKPCLSRYYDDMSWVCVCNSTYCDTISQPDPLNHGEYVLYSTTSSGKRFEKTHGAIKYTLLNNNRSNGFVQWVFNILNINIGHSTLSINPNTVYQTVVGFGGSFTDSVGINFYSLSEATRKRFIESYFSKKGIEYNMGRVPIGCSDFSLHNYAYNMEPENDVLLTNFSLTQEDYDYKISVIKEAMNVATSELYLIASVWTPPAWMKTNKAYHGLSFLIPSFYQTYADYHLKFIEEYDKNNVSIWAITTGNEPTVSMFMPYLNLIFLSWNPVDQATWLANNLGPTIKNSKHSKTLILAYDETRQHILWWMGLMANNKDAVKYMDGIALHWYNDNTSPRLFTDMVRKLLPDKPMISTEACLGNMLDHRFLTHWGRAEFYAYHILDNLNNWYVGWIDWNLALDTNSGPKYSQSRVESLIRVLPESDEFLKLPSFYAMGHFSKFIPRGSKRVQVELDGSKIYNVAFLRPDGSIAVVLLNKFDNNVNVTVRSDSDGHIGFNIPPRSVNTLIYKE